MVQTSSADNYLKHSQSHRSQGIKNPSHSTQSSAHSDANANIDNTEPTRPSVRENPFLTPINYTYDQRQPLSFSHANYSPFTIGSWAVTADPMKIKEEADKARLLERMNVRLDGNNRLDLPGLHPHFEYDTRDRELAFGEAMFDIEDAVTGMGRVSDGGFIGFAWRPDWNPRIPLRPEDIDIDIVLSRFVLQAFGADSPFVKELKELVQRNIASVHLKRFNARLRMRVAGPVKVLNKQTGKYEEPELKLAEGQDEQSSTTATAAAASVPATHLPQSQRQADSIPPSTPVRCSHSALLTPGPYTHAHHQTSETSQQQVLQSPRLLSKYNRPSAEPSPDQAASGTGGNTVHSSSQPAEDKGKARSNDNYSTPIRNQPSRVAIGSPSSRQEDVDNLYISDTHLPNYDPLPLYSLGHEGRSLPPDLHLPNKNKGFVKRPDQHEHAWQSYDNKYHLSPQINSFLNLCNSDDGTRLEIAEARMFDSYDWMEIFLKAGFNIDQAEHLKTLFYADEMISNSHRLAGLSISQPRTTENPYN